MKKTLLRFLTLLMALSLMLASFPALAEDAQTAADTQDMADDEVSDELSDAELKEILALDEVTDEDETTVTVGATYREDELSDYTLSSPAIYTCRIAKQSSLYSERSIESTRLISSNDAVSADVLYVGSNWVIARYNSTIGFIKRERISNVVALDKTNTPPYGVEKHTYIATTAAACPVYKSMSTSDASWVVLNEGTMLSIWKIQDGWAIVPYWRTYGYIPVSALTDVIPVSPTDTPLSSETPIAAYTSYYNMSQDETNKGRIVNIHVGCERLTRVMAAGESFDFNKQVGPYRKSIGYQPAWVLIDGTSVKGYGGGTCQVSSTLYNALLQLPGVEIIQRRPHGPAGAKYLPHGVDAAVGNDNLNLRFRNNYDFPIRVEGHTSNDGALLMVVYRADTAE